LYFFWRFALQSKHDIILSGLARLISAPQVVQDKIIKIPTPLFQ